MLSYVSLALQSCSLLCNVLTSCPIVDYINISGGNRDPKPFPCSQPILYLHVLATLIGTPVYLHIHTITLSDNHVAAVHCIKSCSYRSRALVNALIKHHNGENVTMLYEVRIPETAL